MNLDVFNYLNLIQGLSLTKGSLNLVKLVDLWVKWW